MGNPLGEAPSILIELLDTTTGHPQQTWSFAGKPRILIGRSPDGDVVVSNPYVSRAHAYLEWESGTWQLISISSQQIVVNDRRLKSISVKDGSVFRLGANGCSIRFREEPSAETMQSGQTLSFDPECHPMLHLDQERLSRDVSEIADGDFFQNLKLNLNRLRKPQQGSSH